MRALADTSLFIGREQDRPLNGDLPEELVVSVVTVGELRLGVLMAATLEARSRRLETLRLVESLEPLPIDDQVAAAWSRLVAELRAAGRKAPINDTWIAATALAHDLPVATQDADYDHMPGLKVIRL
ncbi:ribonuclease [Carbonactinospora thermoautotrophica]|uniref:Ribonuclease VapC n=1 Tax=Carbonactinospora thermoautotrophica TaxID=1469144 RepID=A0A132N136_9ACTN|nr:type II toxin-antitoxin system VapC family toxin [Carbonactinospora thermoautotrophica]KWX02557.1 putative ribonuclease VapC [Carbonactinospora thermoautotrophica]KWX03650.1 ribonuclease [Carbonactinospora thermoautotrophica]KWX07894.1 ribonuclease [Carbonactinospora thermoautotrophica]